MDFWITIATVLPVLGLTLVLESRMAIIRAAYARPVARGLAVMNVIVLASIVFVEGQALELLMDGRVGSTEQRQRAVSIANTAMVVLVLNPALILLAVAFGGLGIRARYLPKSLATIWRNRLSSLTYARLNHRTKRRFNSMTRDLLTSSNRLDRLSASLNSDLGVEGGSEARTGEQIDFKREEIARLRTIMSHSYRGVELICTAQINDISEAKAQRARQSKALKKALRDASRRVFDLYLDVLRDQVTHGDIKRDPGAVEQALQLEPMRRERQ